MYSIVKEHKPRWSRLILISYTLIFLSFSIWSLIRRELIAVDRLSIAFLSFLFILIERKYHISPFTAILAGLIFVPHEIGLMGFYGSPFLDYNADFIIHLTTAFFSAYCVLSFVLQNLSKRFLFAALTAFTLTITIGAVIEATEYWGFITVGTGEGYLGFGDGDNSKNFGPWEDSSLDTTSNLLGSFLAIITSYLFFTLRKKTKNISEG